MPVSPKGPRANNDAYPTIARLASAVMPWVVERLPVDLFIEPSCGEGNFVQALLPYGHVTGVDVAIPSESAVLPNEFIHGDWKEVAPTLDMAGTVVVGNPPYNEFVEHFLAAATAPKPPMAISFLLPLTYLSSKKRKRIIYDVFGQPDVLPLAERPSFTGNGRTDANDYGMFFFYLRHKQRVGTLYPAISWK